MKIHAGLPSIALALLTATASPALDAACVEDSSDVAVRVYRFSEGPPAYTFMVINNTNAPILIFSMGGPPVLPINEDNIPSSVGSPAGWEGNYFFEENHPAEYMQFFWEAKNPEMRIPSGASLSGFSIQLRFPVSTEERRLFDPRGRPVTQIDLRDIPFRVILTGGECHSGFTSADRSSQ